MEKISKRNKKNTRDGNGGPIFGDLDYKAN